MEKRKESAFVLYFSMLFILVVTSMNKCMNIVNMVYLVVVLSCSLKFILIVNKNKE